MKKATKSLVSGISAIGLASALAGTDPSPAPATPAPAPAPAAAAAAAPGAPAASAPVSGAKIQFEMPVYDFGKVTAGAPIKYTFIFTNTGCGDLDVDVRPLCGCTAAGDWTHKVQPGKTGSIPIQVNSAQFAGPIDKMVNVNSNDKDQPLIVLHIKGTVWKPIDVNPGLAYFNIMPDGPPPPPFTIHIINNTEQPLTLEPPQSQNPIFSAELKTNEPGKNFDLLVSVKPPDNPGNVNAQITMKSSSATTPMIVVTAMANVQAAVTLIPGQITLPGGPLANPITSTLTVQNFGTNLLVLSEPSVNAKGAEVQVKELNPGKVFSITVTFPAGFEITSEIPTELSIKSSHPKHALIKAPITQLPRPQTTPLAAPVPQPPPANPLGPPLPLPEGRALKVSNPGPVPVQAAPANGAH